MNVEEDKKQI